MLQAFILVKYLYTYYISPSLIKNPKRRNEEWNLVGTLQNVKDFDSKYYDKKVKVLWGRAVAALNYIPEAVT